MKGWCLGKQIMQCKAWLFQLDIFCGDVAVTRCRHQFMKEIRSYKKVSAHGISMLSSTIRGQTIKILEHFHVSRM